MNTEYTFEPVKLEVFLTNCMGSTLLQGYYSNFVNRLNIREHDRILDYCSGSGVISAKIARRLKSGQLVFADVSRVWLSKAEKRMKKYRMASGYHIEDFSGLIQGGNYDKIVIHFSLHDFPEAYQSRIIRQMIQNLKPDGRLIIREPIGEDHGMKLRELLNLMENAGRLAFEYSTFNKPLVGELVDVRCWLK